ncbi:Mitochondrial 10-formyltetrahydrofolate dehydrogenase [Portunus trituberculatus]|uniref:Mitochondrial 10-formyltetrahydrofolate dehydrogenase n=1 Tax=Portunus trituberculatus TaxID=210409 RepID=A0A5B7HE44_PORTR|nr:Mitochondrial 10-formyltetrahydrofolate dehydrogenase [Portunus trituberculatus]
MMNASKYGAAAETSESVELTAEEQEVAEKMRETWKAILNIDVPDDLDFFKAGAGSMDVVRAPTSG